MCGITGLVSFGDRDALARMTSLLAHRGPSDAGLWDARQPDGSYLGLGNRRLAILDLSPAGHMPMASDDGLTWITYNGEVYNFAALRDELAAKGHRFRSGTDTEVVLRLYEAEGPGCVRRLNGMFAFAIADLRRNQLVLARDHFGVKPLYYHVQGRRLAFASEVKALLQAPGVQAGVDPQALHQYLTFLWVPEPRTLFQGIRKLPPGHYAVFRNGELSLTQYWDLDYPPGSVSSGASEDELAQEVRRLFLDSVRRQMVSDVPIGAFLSGGLDSSSIVAAKAHAGRRVQTYTITFPAKHRRGERHLDDPQIARATAQAFGCDHHEIVVEPDVVSLLPKIVWHMDEPVADPALIGAYLVCREAKPTATVLLSGQGGDELFAGYRKHMAHRWAVPYQRLPGRLRRGLIEPAVLALPSMRGTPVKGFVRLAKKLAVGGSLAPDEAFLAHCTYLTTEQQAALCAGAFLAETAGLDPYATHRALFSRAAHADFLHQMLYVDAKVFLASLNLNYTDKMSMASSVEVRVPFLDLDLAEFVVRNVPPQLKLKGTLQPRTKHILRKAMAGLLPPYVLRQPKAGFGAPVDYWLARDLREMVDDLLSERRITQRGLLRPEAVRQLVAEQRSGRRDWSMQIWQLLTLELWHQAFIDSQGVQASSAGASAVPSPLPIAA